MTQSDCPTIPIEWQCLGLNQQPRIVHFLARAQKTVAHHKPERVNRWETDESMSHACFCRTLTVRAASFCLKTKSHMSRVPSHWVVKKTPGLVRCQQPSVIYDLWYLWQEDNTWQRSYYTSFSLSVRNATKLITKFSILFKSCTGMFYENPRGHQGVKDTAISSLKANHRPWWSNFCPLQDRYQL